MIFFVFFPAFKQLGLTPRPKSTRGTVTTIHYRGTIFEFCLWNQQYFPEFYKVGHLLEGALIWSECKTVPALLWDPALIRENTVCSVVLKVCTNSMESFCAGVNFSEAARKQIVTLEKLWLYHRFLNSWEKIVQEDRGFLKRDNYLAWMNIWNLKQR